MITICVTDSKFKDTLVSEGARVLQEKKDVNGRLVWTLSADKLSFNIGAKEYEGKFQFVKRPKLFF